MVVWVGGLESGGLDKVLLGLSMPALKSPLQSIKGNWPTKKRYRFQDSVWLGVNSAPPFPKTWMCMGKGNRVRGRNIIETLPAEGGRDSE